jgi:hypothetical protein
MPRPLFAASLLIVAMASSAAGAVTCDPPNSELVGDECIYSCHPSALPSNDTRHTCVCHVHKVLDGVDDAGRVKCKQGGAWMRGSVNKVVRAGDRVRQTTRNASSASGVPQPLRSLDVCRAAWLRQAMRRASRHSRCCRPTAGVLQHPVGAPCCVCVCACLNV